MNVVNTFSVSKSDSSNMRQSWVGVKWVWREDGERVETEDDEELNWVKIAIINSALFR